MVFFDFLHDVTLKINNSLVEVDKIFRIKNKKNNFKEIEDDNVLLYNLVEKKIINKNRYLSHHELHAYSVIQFIKKNNIEINDIYILVNDGSGTLYNRNNKNLAECVSLYYYNFNQHRIKNIFSYSHNIENNLLKNYSPSLMYFLVCSHLNLILGEEGKILAFESNVKTYNSEEKINKVNKFINIILKYFKINFHKNLMENNKIYHQERIYNANLIFKNFFVINHLFKKEIFDNKYIIAYTLQTLYEKIILYIVNYSIEKYKIKNLGYCGGGAFNVKLNNLILNMVPEKLIINPVPSDLGINYFRYQKDIINSYSRYTLPKKFNKHLKD